jgi:hypothetical protein
MPQLQNLVLTDRTPVTPVNHTFIPRDISPDGVASVVESTGIPVGESRVTLLQKKSGSKLNGELRLAVPVVQTETINGVSRPVVVRTAYVTVKTTFDQESSEQERTNAIGMIADALGTGKALVHDTLVKLQGVY